jgi:hypothetical protein
MPQLEQLTDLDLAHSAVLAGVDPGKRLERHTRAIRAERG